MPCDMASLSVSDSEEMDDERILDAEYLKNVFTRVEATNNIPVEAIECARHLCAKHLGGAWNNVPLYGFGFKVITGGLSNLLFLVSLPADHPPQYGEPYKALLRIHCQADQDQLLTESVIFSVLSERDIGPRLYAVFPGGRFEEFIPSRPLLCVETSQPHYAKHIAPLFAQVHVLNVPVSKNPEFMTFVKGWIEKLRSSPSGKKPIQMKTQFARVNALDHPAHVTVDDLENEYHFVQNFLKHSNSPIVFSHNDSQERNIILLEGYEIREDGKVYKHDKVTEETPMTLIDYEYCNYNYRGFDIGNHFCEQAFDYDVEEWPFYKMRQEKFENSKLRQIFCESYLDELHKLKIEKRKEGAYFPKKIISGERKADMQQLISETYLFMPVSNFAWAVWALVNAEDAAINFDYASYARDRLAMYYKQKTMLMEYLENLENNEENDEDFDE